jgi:uncharacterized protein (TIGR03437 family)
MRLAVFIAFGFPLAAQLIPVGQPVPKGPNPPVVFVDGYQGACTGSGFASNFDQADQLMQANNIVTLYFDNCTVNPPAGQTKPDIETVGAAFGQFLAALKYTDGTPVAQVDVVAHSMGGLVVRSYLSGKQSGSATFNPPAAPPLRRIVFLATPHFGTTLASELGSDVQTAEMSPGSAFLVALNTWNQGTDDLRGLSAIAVSGNGGTGVESGTPGFDDGVITLMSSSLAFYRTGVTRIVPDCHTMDSLLTFGGLCASTTPDLNQITNQSANPVSQILASFLTGTTAWQTVGQPAEQNAILAANGGVNAVARDQNDNPLQISGTALATTSAGAVKLSLNANASAYSEKIPATATTLLLSPVSGSSQSVSTTIPAATVLTAVVKAGPIISPKGVICAAGPAPFPYDVAPGAYVSVYGSNLASATTSATQPYPTQIGDVQVLVNGIAQPVVFVSAGQINFVYANATPGVTQLTVKNANGQNTVNVRVAPAVPSIFLLDANSTAAAVDVTTGAVVSASTPFHSGNIMSLYLTGLGATTLTNGLNYAQIVPTVTVGGQSCPVLYAGRSPGFAGLDQINCTIPALAAGSALPVVVTSNGRASNTAYIPLQ